MHGNLEGFRVLDLADEPGLLAGRLLGDLGAEVVQVEHVVEANAIRFSTTPEGIRTPAPRLGEHTEQVFRELLGMSDAEYRALSEKGVFE